MKKILNLCVAAVSLTAIMAITACTNHVDYHYGHDHDHWDHHDHGWHGGHGHHLAVAVADSETQDPAILLAQDYGISTVSAQKITAFAAGTNDAQALLDFGVSANELVPLANLEMPSQESIQKMAANLGEDQTKIATILADFISDIRAENAQK
jgi:hypothetical protein